jgi:hypothetical protein
MCSTDGQTFPVECLYDFGCEYGFEPSGVRVLVAQVSEHVFAPAHRLQFFALHIFSCSINVVTFDNGKSKAGLLGECRCRVTGLYSASRFASALTEPLRVSAHSGNDPISQEKRMEAFFEVLLRASPSRAQELGPGFPNLPRPAFFEKEVFDAGLVQAG